MVISTQRGDVPPRIANLLERAVRELAAGPGIRHAIVGVEPGDCSYCWIGAAGDADPAGSPMTPETPFFLASVTKLYIGAAVLRLHEQGRLSIDDPLGRHLPPELVSDLHRRRGVDWTDGITLRHLLGHASGLRDYLTEAPRGSKPLLGQVLKDGDRRWDIAGAMRIVRSLPEAPYTPRPFDGRRHTVRYSDTNFLLLVAVIEAATGRPVHEAFTKLLYEPLGLTRTWHPGTPAEAGMPPAAVLWAGDKPMHAPLALCSSRDLFSTAGETLRFLRALVTGELFDDPATAGLMWRHWNPLGFRLVPTAPSWPIEYGLAMMRFQAPRLLAPLLRIPTLIGHTGSSGSWLFYAPESDLYVTGTVDQFAAPAVPFDKVPKLIRQMRSV